MKRKTVLLVVLAGSLALILLSHAIRGSISSRPSLLLPLIVGQLVGVNLIPCAVGGVAYAIKRTREAFLWGWGIAFVLFGIGFLYQASLERGRNLFE